MKDNFYLLNVCDFEILIKVTEDSVKVNFEGKMNFIRKTKDQVLLSDIQNRVNIGHCVF